jgi:uncharacterized membrane protein
MNNNGIARTFTELASMIATFGIVAYVLGLILQRFETLLPWATTTIGVYALATLGILAAFAVILWAFKLVGRNEQLIGRLEEFGDNTIGKIPIIEIVYNTIKSVIAFTLGSAIKDNYTVVMINNSEYKCTVFGLITRTNNSDVSDNPNMVTVYIPTAYNVGTGLVVLMDVKDLTVRPDLSPQQVFRFVTVGGFGTNNVTLVKKDSQ